jgi:RNA polymerase sigma-70 factor (ECF subfamily)
VTRNAEDARDAAQAGMLKAVRALPRFRQDSPFRPWLLRIVANEAKDARLSSMRHRSEPLEDAALELIPSMDPGPEAVAEREEEREALLEAINVLPLDDRLVIAYRYFLGLTEAEMAAALDCPRGTVKSRLSRAIGRLRQQLLDPALTNAGGAAHD